MRSANVDVDAVLCLCIRSSSGDMLNTRAYSLIRPCQCVTVCVRMNESVFYYICSTVGLFLGIVFFVVVAVVVFVFMLLLLLLLAFFAFFHF